MSRSLWALVLVGCLGAGILTGAVHVVLAAMGLGQVSWWMGAVVGSGLALGNGLIVMAGQRRRSRRLVHRSE